MAREVLFVVLIGLLCIGCCGWAPVVPPDAGLDDKLASYVSYVEGTRDLPDEPSHQVAYSPYGRIKTIEVRRREFRSIGLALRDGPSAIVVLNTKGGLAVERVSCPNLNEGWRAYLLHAELAPSEVPGGVLTEDERRTHEQDFAKRGKAAEYTSGGV